MPHDVFSRRDAKGSGQVRPVDREGGGAARTARPTIDDAGVPVGYLLPVEAERRAAAGRR